ncbi:MAG: hypothetical protein ACU85U_07895 [Gammaproteobacteria bacterium]|jgi:hypothetical protein
MTISRSASLTLLCVTALLLLPARHARAAELEYMTLNGVGRVAVAVEGVRDDFSRFGLRSGEIRDRTIAVLREHGIDVVDTDAMSHDPATALLRIDLNANENLYRFFLYGLSIEIVQKIPLNNPAGGYISQIVWQKGQTGMVMPTDMRKLNAIVSELLVKFLDDYHAQNPQRLSSSP